MGKNKAILNTKNFDEILDIQYGKIGTEIRDEFEKNANKFVDMELLKQSKWDRCRVKIYNQLL